MKVDLAIWAKNGARYLPSVLRRVDEVVPEECISQKIFVDDRSMDGTREIARDFNWTVYENPTGFIGFQLIYVNFGSKLLEIEAF